MSTFFHVGLPKTGTTTLQYYVFYNSVYFLQMESVKNKNKHKNDFLRKYGLGNTNNYSDDILDKEIKEKMFNLHEHAVKSGKIFVYSDESITGKLTNISFQKTNAEIIKSISQYPQVIMTIREQTSTLISRYRGLSPLKIWSSVCCDNRDNTKKMNIKARRRMPSFTDWLSCIFKTYHSNYFSNLLYYSLYKSYADILGAENVHILVFEELKQNPIKYAESLAGILGIDSEWMHNQLIMPHKNKAEDKLRKRIFKLARNGGLGPLNTLRLSCHALSGRGGFNPEVNEKQREQIRAIYGSENASLDRELGLGLADYDYAM